MITVLHNLRALELGLPKPKHEEYIILINRISIFISIIRIVYIIIRQRNIN